MYFETWLESDLLKPIRVKSLSGVVFSQDNEANLVGVKVFRGNEPIELEGTVTGYIIKSNGETVTVTGEIHDTEPNWCYIIVPQEAYAVGHISIVIKITNDGVITSLGACSAYVYQSRTGNETVPSGTPIPDFSTLTDLIADAEDATDAANDAADAATAVAESIEGAIAVPFDEDEANEAGTYVTKDGKMYFLPNGHEADVTWANTTKVETNSGKELSDLKNHLESSEAAIWTGGYLRLPIVWERGSINASYEEVSEARTDFARTKDYFAPQKNMVLDASFVFENSAAFVVCQYTSGGVGESRSVYHAYTASEVEAMKSLQLTKGKKYRFCYTANSSSIVVDYTNMDNYITLKSPVLDKAVDIQQLSNNLSQFFSELTDCFGNGATPYRTKNITYSIDGNAIELETSDTTSYIVFDVPCVEGHKYALYLDLTGTLENSNYKFEIRLFNKTSGAWSSIGIIKELSQTSGADIAETVVFSVGTGEGGCLTINAPNKTGETIEGNVFLYDVTDLSNNEIGIIDFSSIGTSKTILLVNGSGQVENKWFGKKVVFYGDSITQGQYPEMVQNEIGFELVKNAVGGSRFGYISNDPSINANALSSDTRIETIPSDADAVLIMGGTNDFSHTQIEDNLVYSSGFDRTKFKGAVAYTIQKVQAQCPNAVIFLLTLIGGRGNADPSILQPLPLIADAGAGQGKSSLDIRNATVEVADYLNIPVIDTWECGITGLNRNTTIKDSVHPTDKGNKLIARFIVNAIKNGSPL